MKTYTVYLLADAMNEETIEAKNQKDAERKAEKLLQSDAYNLSYPDVVSGWRVDDVIEEK